MTNLRGRNNIPVSSVKRIAGSGGKALKFWVKCGIMVSVIVGTAIFRANLKKKMKNLGEKTRRKN